MINALLDTLSFKRFPGLGFLPVGAAGRRDGEHGIQAGVVNAETVLVIEFFAFLFQVQVEAFIQEPMERVPGCENQVQMMARRHRIGCRIM